MKTAKELLLAYLENIGNADVQIELFADNAVIELPYFASLGAPAHWEGKETLYNFLKNLPKSFPGFKFHDIHIYIDTPDQAFGQYLASGTVASNGNAYQQHYMGRVVAENGKIKLLREALNMVPVLKDVRGIAVV